MRRCPLLALHPALTGVLVVVATLLVGATTLFVFTRGEQRVPGDVVETPTAAAVTPAAAPATPPPTPTPAPTPEPVAVVGLFDTPRSLPGAARELTPPGREFPRSDLPPTFRWDGVSTMVYDRQTGEVIDLGPGEPGVFSPSGEWVAWVSGTRFSGKVHALNLRTGERKDFGFGGYVSVFVDDQRFLLDNGNPQGSLVDVLTGEREAVEDRPALFESFGDWLQISSPSENRPRLIRISDRAGTRTLEFEARSAVQIGTDELLVATVPQDGLSNIFTVDFATARATYVATTAVSETGFALSGNGTHIAWSPDVCDDPGETWVFDRRTAELTYAPKALLVSPAARAPDGLLGTGFTGLERLIDPETMEYVFISPAGWPIWSPDYRYVSVGTVGGHGSICSP